MKICILQPAYIPWKGYFHQIYKSDIFVFFDTVQYDRRGWRNRNKIKTPRGLKWLTVPVHAHGTHDGLAIKDVAVVDAHWTTQHLQTIQLNYRQAPFYKTVYPWLAEQYRHCADLKTIRDIDCHLIQQIARQIGITGTRFVTASDLPADDPDPSRRLLKIVQYLQGDTYLSGPAAQDYLDTAMFRSAGVDIEWMTYGYPEYPQLYPPFEHGVSIVDMLMMTGWEECHRFIWNEVQSTVGQESYRAGR